MHNKKIFLNVAEIVNSFYSNVISRIGSVHFYNFVARLLVAHLMVMVRAALLPSPDCPASATADTTTGRHQCRCQNRSGWVRAGLEQDLLLSALTSWYLTLPASAGRSARFLKDRDMGRSTPAQPTQLV